MTEVDQSQSKECTEVSINVPWGHIAGKWWGPKEGRPLLALHGWQDNAGTFDTLIPLLPSHIGVLAIDFPGHGLSSQISRGQMYHYIDYVNIVCMIIKKYGWNQVSILGHSMGAIVGFQLAAIFPERVDLLIELDSYKPLNSLQMNYGHFMALLIKGFLTEDERNIGDSEPPSYNYSECIEKLYVGTVYSIHRDKCRYILNRNTKESSKHPTKYYFTRDSRLKYANMGVWPREMYSKLIGRIKCPTLMIRALGSPLTNMQDLKTDLAMMRTNPMFEYYEADGSHHMHLNEPHKVSGAVNRFLLKYWSAKTSNKSRL